jgi:tRNA (guanine-N7-)-methyltransferase
MARKKLMRFEENKSNPQVFEPSKEEVLSGLSLKGKWMSEHFQKDAPLVLELGCGKGEYTVAMAQRFPDACFIGVDVKGARIWYGASTLQENNMHNAAFLRTQIEWIEGCFAEGEIDEIWITFPDPQIKHRRSKHRLTHPRMLDRYAKLLKKGGKLHLKTDSEFLHGYTVGVLESRSDFKIETAYFDIDLQLTQKQDLLHSVQTHYEMLFREKGKAITYLCCTRN